MYTWLSIYGARRGNITAYKNCIKEIFAALSWLYDENFQTNEPLGVTPLWRNWNDKMTRNLIEIYFYISDTS